MKGEWKMGEEYGIPQHQRPDAPIIGAPGNIFSVIGIARRALKKAGLKDEAEEMQRRIITTAKSYNQALQMVMHYVNPVSI